MCLQIYVVSKANASYKKVSQYQLSIKSNMSKYQIACRKGHRASEHLFVLKSVFQQFKENKEEFRNDKTTILLL